jgi:cytochrome c-type biogenesis protein CcmH/NrfF
VASAVARDAVPGRPGAGGAAPRALLRRGSFVLALVVTAVALAVGSGLGRGGPVPAAARAAALDARIRCPSCVDVSVAQSTATSAIAVRDEVLHLARGGLSDQAIEARLVAQYGPSILLSPPASGLLGLVWFVPLAAALAAVGAVAAMLWRRARAFRRLRGTT